MLKKWISILFLFPLLNLTGQSYEIERFELLNTEDGLSHNSVMSMFCDSRGFIWVGTMDGLNRYNGYDIEVFKADKDDMFSLNNNRITSIWEDLNGFIWLKTHDGYVHYFDPSTERFYTYPKYRESDEEKSSSILSFNQISQDEIWLGSNSSGAYRLCLVEDSVYCVEQFRSRGTNPITNNRVTFISEDPEKNVWVGTNQGLNRFTRNREGRTGMVPEHFLVDHSFTAALSTSSFLWLGTREHGVIRYEPITRRFTPLALFPQHVSPEITGFHLTRDEGYMVIGTAGYGVCFYERSSGQTTPYALPGERVETIFEDSYGSVWITTDAFGVTMIQPHLGKSSRYMLTSPETQHLIDEERTYFFEDSRKNLWIGTHGGGLARYDRERDQFEFYRNDPRDLASIGSNFVYSIIEDHSGLIWVGTGQFNGGLNKAIPVNSTFRHFQPRKSFTDFAENVIRSIFEDQWNRLWLANKSGDILIYDSDLKPIKILKELPLTDDMMPGMNVYTMMQDRKGYLWLGSKGGGVAVSTRPLSLYQSDLSDLAFHLYTRENSGLSGLSNNMIYSILEDTRGTIWIGTYGGGINRVESRSGGELICTRFDHTNSNLNSPYIRHIFEDSMGRLWFATTFGAHLLESPESNDSAMFRSFIYEPSNPASLSYNDVIHIFEDSSRDLWFGTFGGGLNKLINLDSVSASFMALDDEKGLANDAVFGILQDSLDFIWASTENGISRIDPVTFHTENYNNNNGLRNSNFSENACLRLNGGAMVFGNTEGILFISPGEVKKDNFIPPVVFTNLYISNTLVNFKADHSPIGRHINFLEEIVLSNDQSSFSLEFAALSYFDTRKNLYQYKLEQYDDSWNSPGVERRATYTKVPPGEYNLLVKGSSWDGTWNDTPRSLGIVIRPPWWRTTLAKIIYLVVLLLVVEISRRLFMNYYRLRNDLMVEKRINEIKLQFFTNISHEIRTPLTLILGPVEDIRKQKDLPATVMEPLEIIQRNSKRILRLVNQLLDFRKIQNRKTQLQVQQVDLGNFLLDVCHNFDYLALQKRIRFRYPTELENSMVWFDPDKMDTVLFNILSNAFKFTPEGKGIYVEVGFPGDGKQFRITVTDEGTGIPEEKLSLMFQRYTSLATEKMTLTGTGIGLAFSNEIVKAHGGSLKVESKMGEGSRFFIEVPARKEAYPPKQIREGTVIHHTVEQETVDLLEVLSADMETGSGTGNDPEIKKPSLLLVEDHYDIRQYIKQLLSQEFEIEEAVNGVDGLRKISRNPPDLIITDLMMAEMDGLEMTRRIKDDFNTSHIPVIMLTARSSVDNQIEGIESGAEAYILKPFNALYLKTVIRNLLRQRKLLNRKLFTEQQLDPEEIRITSRDEQFLREVVRIIESHYHEYDFTVDKLTGLSEVSRTVFYHKIKSLTGMPPVQFLRQTRIRIAANLLLSNGYNISEIAYMTGFSDVKYFRKCFKEVFGVTPSSYRSSRKSLEA